MWLSAKTGLWTIHVSGPADGAGGTTTEQVCPQGPAQLGMFSLVTAFISSDHMPASCLNLNVKNNCHPRTGSLLLRERGKERERGREASMCERKH